MRVLLTGASGYLGLHLLGGLLDAGHHVTALVRDPHRLGPLASHPHTIPARADLTDHARVAEIVAAGHDACVHAALIWGEPGEELGLPDTIAAARLFEAAGQAGVGCCVLISSTAVHRPFTPLMSEADPLTTADLYGATKAAAELFLWAACATHAMRGVALRAGPIVGPPAHPGGAHRSDRRLRAMVEAAAHHAPLHALTHDGRQLVAAADVTRATLAALHTPDASGPYLCADHRVTCWADIAALILDTTPSTSALHLATAPDAQPAPRFDTSRIEALLGGPLDSHRALIAHIEHLYLAASITS